jgi:hypothetical protein
VVHWTCEGGLLPPASAPPPATLTVAMLLSLPVALRVLALAVSLCVVVGLTARPATAITAPPIPSSTWPALALSLPAAGGLICSSVHLCFNSLRHAGTPFFDC